MGSQRCIRIAAHTSAQCQHMTRNPNRDCGRHTVVALDVHGDDMTAAMLCPQCGQMLTSDGTCGQEHPEPGEHTQGSESVITRVRRRLSRPWEQIELVTDLAPRRAPKQTRPEPAAGRDQRQRGKVPRWHRAVRWLLRARLSARRKQ